MNVRAVLIWLTILEVLVLVMIAIGGITRLTDSGLSMTDWKPILGTVYPINSEEWERRFNLYKDSPEGKVRAEEMRMADFKFIFFWEYLHRMLGRLVGLIYLLPFLFWAFRRQLPHPWLGRFAIGFVLLAGQGIMGWIMVLSGLSDVDKPHVSPYRLAVHLVLAFLLFQYLWWQILILRNCSRFPDSGLRRLALGVTFMLGIQIVYGAFTAGLNAGYMYNTFPNMGSGVLPPGLNVEELGLFNWFQNPVAVQFVHRWLGVGMMFLVIGLVVVCQRQGGNSREIKRTAGTLLLLVAAQVGLGIWTLLSHVKIPIAIGHQLGGCLLLTGLVTLVYQLSREKTA